MASLLVPRSPLIVVSRTIVLLISTGATLLLILICEWLNPHWSRTIIVLQGIALLMALMAYRWQPSRRLLLYPFLLAVVAYLWDSTLPAPSLPDGAARILLPLILLVGMVGDALLSRRRVLPFVPRRVRVYGNYVNLDEAALFFRIPPDVMRLQCARDGHAVVTGRSGEEYIALDDLMVVVETIAQPKT
jgi:hypothetical protein